MASRGRGKRAARSENSHKKLSWVATASHKEADPEAEELDEKDFAVPPTNQDDLSDNMSSDHESGEEDEDADEDSDSELITPVLPSSKSSKHAPKAKVEAKEITGAGPSAIPMEEYSDSSEEEIENTVGDVPMKWYDDYDHVGYNRSGQKIMRKTAKKDQLDAFLNSNDASKRWTIYDPLKDEEVTLTQRDREIIKNIKQGKFPEPEFNPFETFGDIGEVRIHPVLDLPEPKSRFIPSKYEAQRVNYLVKAIQKGWIKVDEPTKKQSFHLLWEEDTPTEAKKPAIEQIPAPRMKLPGHSESYNPPAEYLLSEEELKALELLDPEERPLNFIPKKVNAMRLIPGYSNAMKERFERCLDLYLAPRKIQQRRWVDNPDDLLPQLPHPRELRPFPTTETILYLGHTDKVRTVSIDQTGQWLASGSDDKSVIIWEIATGRLWKRIDVGAVVQCVQWCPATDLNILAVAVLFAIRAGMLPDLYRTADQNKASTTQLTIKSKISSDKAPVSWVRTSETDQKNGVLLAVQHHAVVKKLVWHQKGDYLAAVCPDAPNAQVIIHQLSRKMSQSPFKKNKGPVETVLFHPAKPIFFVGTQRFIHSFLSCLMTSDIRVYNLLKQEMIRKLMPGAKFVSCLAIHPGGDNLLMGSYDRRLCWFDLDLSARPYRTMRYHTGAIRSTAFHSRLPLFASCADDATVHVFHGMVYSDLLQNPLIVPVKILRGHATKDDLGVLDCAFHPSEPWIFSAGADATIRLFTC